MISRSAADLAITRRLASLGSHARGAQQCGGTGSAAEPDRSWPEARCATARTPPGGQALPHACDAEHTSADRGGVKRRKRLLPHMVAFG